VTLEFGFERLDRPDETVFRYPGMKTMGTLVAITLTLCSLSVAIFARDAITPLSLLGLVLFLGLGVLVLEAGSIRRRDRSSRSEDRIPWMDQTSPMVRGWTFRRGWSVHQVDA
jgi:hypothetical protein